MAIKQTPFNTTNDNIDYSETLLGYIFDYGLFEKKGRLYTKSKKNGILLDREVSERELENAYNTINPAFVQLFQEINTAFKNNKHETSEEMTLVEAFGMLVAYMKLVEYNPLIPADTHASLNESKKFLATCLLDENYGTLFSLSLAGYNASSLLPYLSKNNIIPSDFFNNNFDILLPILKNVGVDELIGYNKKAYISKENLSQIIAPKDLLMQYRCTNNSKYLRAIPDANIIDLYINSVITINELKEARLSTNSILSAISQEKLSSNDVLILAQDKNFESIFPNSDKLFEQYKNMLINSKTLLELAKLGKFDVNKLPELYLFEEALSRAIILPAAFEGAITTLEDYRNFFSVDMLIKLEQEGKLSEKIVEFYKSSILPTKGDDLHTFEDCKKQQLGELELNSSNVNTIISLVKKGIFTIKDIESINYIDIESKLASLSPQELCILYSAGKIDEAYLLDISPDELLDFWKKGFLPNQALEILNPGDFIEKFEKEDFTGSDLLVLYNQGLLTQEQLPLSSTEINASVLQLQLSDSKIIELFVGKKIDFDTLHKLYEKGKVSPENYNKAIEEYDIESEMEKIRQLSTIHNTAVPDGPIIAPSPAALSGPIPVTKKVSIDPELRNEFLEALGCESSIPISTGALKGYMFIPIPSLKTAVLEKLYNTNSRTGALTPALDNATFVLPLIKALELAQSSNKTDLRKLDNVFPVNHTKNWGLNILKSISKRNPNFHFNRYKEDYNDLIELITQNYLENRG